MPSTGSQRITREDLKRLNRNAHQWLADRRIRKRTDGPGNSIRAAASAPRIWRDNRTGLPIFATGSWKNNPAPSGALQKSDTRERIFSFLRNNRKLLRLDSPENELRIVRTDHDQSGEAHVRLRQVYRGVPVFGKELILHIGRDGRIRGFNGRYATTPRELISLEGRTASDQAIAAVRKDLGWGLNAVVEQCEKTIYAGGSGKPVLVWHVTVKSGFWRWQYFIDADLGTVVHRIRDTRTDGPAVGSGTDLQGKKQILQVYQKGSDFFLVNLSKPMYQASQSEPPERATGGIVIFDARNQDPGEGDDPGLALISSPDSSRWQANAVSASAHMDACYDYYRNVHERNSIDDTGASLYAVINLGLNYDNAVWDGVMAWFGNGDGETTGDFVGSLDVVGHEYTHGVTQYTANLIYENQSGAIDEAFSNMFGEFIEYYTEGVKTDWYSGEDIYTPGIPGDTMNDLADPANDDPPSPGTMSEYQNLPNTDEGDNGGVHVNSTIVSRACVLMAKTIGIDKAEKILYRVLQHYLTQDSRFIDMRLGCAAAAGDLYGETEVEAVRNSFDTVEIFEGMPTPPPAEYPVAEGDEWIVNAGINDGPLYLTSTDGSTHRILTPTPASATPAVSSDGSYCFFVDAVNDLRVINTDGTDEENLTGGSDLEGWIYSIALSYDGSWLSLTSIYADSAIYLLNLGNMEIANTCKLYNPTDAPEPMYDVVYADAMDWFHDDQYLVYDCMHARTTAYGDTLVFWTINRLRISDGKIDNLFRSLQEGMNMGNPRLANTNDHVVAYDYSFDDEKGNILYSEIRSIDLDTGDEGVVVSYNDDLLGYPCFSPDDKAILFHGYVFNEKEGDFSAEGLLRIDLLADQLNGNQEAGLWMLIEGSTYPKWFIRKSDASNASAPVETSDGFRLDAIYPNPFNPSTRISYRLNQQGDVSLKIYDTSGREVKSLVRSKQPSGRHEILWDGRNDGGNAAASGTYILQLRFQDRIQCRKMLLLR